MIYLNILYIFDQNFTLVPTIKLLEFSDKNWETWWASFDVFGRFFDYFFLSSKVSKIKLNQKSLIYKNTTLYDIDFYQKIRILRFFLRKFLLTVFRHYFIKNTPQISLSKFWKIPTFMIYPWYIIYFWSDILRHRFPNNQTIRFLLIKIEKLESVYLCFWSIFHRLFFLSSKVSKNRNLIHKIQWYSYIYDQTLYDIDFYQSNYKNFADFF